MEKYFKFIPSNISILAAYSSISTSCVLFRTAYNQIMPRQLHDHLLSMLKNYFSHKSTSSTFFIDELWDGQERNMLYDAAQAYLSTKIGPTNHNLKVGKLQRNNKVSFAMASGGKLEDTFRGVPITWFFDQIKKSKNNDRSGDFDSKRYRIVFESKYMGIVQGDYLNHVLDTYRALMEKEKVLKLFTPRNGYERGLWNPVKFHHPASFNTLALDPEIKKALIDDLDRFMARKDFYKKVGKAWKRGYLLHGPPGTGKSSLIAAMANYLHFDIYDLELGNISLDADLRRLLLCTTDRSILVVEDIDCNSEVHDRSKNKQQELKQPQKTKSFSLSTLLNCIDGLWSSCGEARIVVFTTNHKEVLDPALLRPGRMDMQINLSYCTSKGFRILASNYLGIDDDDHVLFQEIDELIKTTNVTPASMAEELMKSDDADTSLGQVVNFLKRKHNEQSDSQEKVKRHKILC